MAKKKLKKTRAAAEELRAAAAQYVQALEQYRDLREHLARDLVDGKLHAGISLAGDGLTAAEARLVRAARHPVFDDDMTWPGLALAACWPLPEGPNPS